LLFNQTVLEFFAVSTKMIIFCIFTVNNTCETKITFLCNRKRCVKSFMTILKTFKLFFFLDPVGVKKGSYLYICDVICECGIGLLFVFKSIPGMGQTLCRTNTFSTELTQSAKKRLKNIFKILGHFFL